jgi:hypothetical protein
LAFTSCTFSTAGVIVTVEPEREMVRKALPFFLPAALLALVAGTALGGLDAGWSAAIGTAVVALNFAAHGLSLARAARSSLVVLASVAVVGVIVRLAAIVVAMAILNTFAFFSPRAFALAVVPATALLLAFEMKVVAGRSGAWWVPEGGRPR